MEVHRHALTSRRSALVVPSMCLFRSGVADHHHEVVRVASLDDGLLHPACASRGERSDLALPARSG